MGERHRSNTGAYCAQGPGPRTCPPMRTPMVANPQRSNECSSLGSPRMCWSPAGAFASSTTWVNAGPRREVLRLRFQRIGTGLPNRRSGNRSSARRWMSFARTFAAICQLRRGCP